MPQSRFETEAEMIPPLLEALRTYSASDPRWTWICELPADHGIPDLALMRFLPENLHRRTSAGSLPITKRAEMAVVLALGRGPMELVQLAARVNQSPTSLKRLTILPLLDRGLVDSSEGELVLRQPYVPLIDRITAIEVKRRDWRTALDQARRYRGFADRVMVALEADIASRLMLDASALREQRIGLVAVEAEERRARVLLGAKRSRPFSETSFALAGERAWAALSAGRMVYRADSHVFGRQGLTAAAVLPMLRDAWADCLPLAA